MTACRLRAGGSAPILVGMKTTALLLALALTASCKSREVSPPAEEAPATKVAPEIFGAPLTNVAETPLDTVIASPEEFAGKTVRVSGTARRVCQRKGCWMELATTSSADAPACRVKFKDYGFFVPTDSAGALAVLEGEVQLKKVRASRVEHLEEEGAVFASKNPDGSANEIQIVANGVEIMR